MSDTLKPMRGPPISDETLETLRLMIDNRRSSGSRGVTRERRALVEALRLLTGEA
jgi:hypothetical protein